MRKIVPAHGRECAPIYVRRRKTPLTYLFFGRPARLGGPNGSGKGLLGQPSSIQPYWPSLRIAAQLLGQGALRASLEAMLQLRQTDDANRSFIADAHKFAARVPLHGHGWHDRYTHASGHHGNDGRKLTALEYHVWAHARSAAGQKRVFPKAMAFLEQKKWVFADFVERQRSARGKPMVLGESGEERLAEKLLRYKLLAANGQR